MCRKEVKIKEKKRKEKTTRSRYLDMSLLDSSLLRAMGIRPTGYRVPIPLYMTVRHSGDRQASLLPEIVSRQEIAALLLQIDDHLQFSRFITLPLRENVIERRPGPASRTVFAVQPPSSSLPMLGDPRFRTELSSVYSQIYFLHQHALVTSVQENRPLLSYFDREAYLLASQLYPPFTTPLDDLDACDQYPFQSWKQVYQQANLI